MYVEELNIQCDPEKVEHARVLIRLCHFVYRSMHNIMTNASDVIFPSCPLSHFTYSEVYHNS